MYLFNNIEREPNIQTLDNGLALSVIRGDTTALPIISISIAAGHYHESTHCYGFSHLLEHMIFHHSKMQGNNLEKTPDTNHDLEKLIGSHHGYINAWTHASHTNFHLTCAKEGFSKACEILIDKIAHPLFEQNAIQAEIAAIEEEYRLRLKDPVRSLFSVRKSIANKEHPFHRFTVGNRETLQSISVQEMQEQLQQHHRQYFHSGNIAVSIHLPAKGDFTSELHTITHTLTQSIASGQANHKLSLPDLYPQAQLNKWVHVHIEHSHSQLIMCWFVDKSDDMLDNSALSMIRHLIESKHLNGMFDLLYKAQYVRTISLTNGIEQAHQQEVQLHLTLSHRGSQHKDKVVELVLQFLAFLNSSQLANWRFDELKKQQDLLEAHQHGGDPVEVCINDAQALHDCASNESKDSQDTRISYHQVKQRIRDILAVMQNNAHQIYCIDDGLDERFESNKQYSEFYNVPFAIEDWLATRHQSQAPHLAATPMLAPQNLYMPSHLLSVTPELPENTIKVMEHHGVLLKFAQIVKAGQARGDCFVSINSASMCDTLAHTMSKKIWVEAFATYCKKRFYQAIDAGISFRVYGHQHGVTIHTTGFSDKQIDFLLELIDCALHFKINEDEFSQVKNAILKRLSTRLFNRPINRLFAHLSTFVQGNTYSLRQQVDALENMAYATLNDHQEEFFKHNCVEALIAGNWRLYCAQKLHQQLQARLTAKGLWQKPAIQAERLPEPCMPLLPETFEDGSQNDCAVDCAVVLYQQVRHLNDQEDCAHKSQAICLLLEHLLGPHVFARLRKNMGLAYLVGVGYKPVNSQAGLAIYLQSSTGNAAQIYQAISEVVKELIDNWEDTASEIQRAKPGISQQCEPFDREVSNIAMRLWTNYDDNEPYMQYQQLQAAIAELTSTEIKDWLCKLYTANEGQLFLSNDATAFEHDALAGFSYRPHLK